MQDGPTRRVKDGETYYALLANQLMSIYKLAGWLQQHEAIKVLPGTFCTATVARPQPLRIFRVFVFTGHHRKEF